MSAARPRTIVAGFCFGLVSLLIAGADAGVTPAPPNPLAGVKFEAGKVTRIDDPLTGGNGYWLVYLPQDYVPARLWPVIYCYHGKDGEPTVFPFKEVTDGKGFIVIGMEYLDRKAGGTREADLPNLRRIHDAIATRLPIHEKVQFIGGFSQGGWSTGNLSEASLDTWAGIIITGAGRGAPGNDPKVGGKPIFVGIGEDDPARPAAQSAADFYKQHGADVTLEIFKGKAHAVDTADAVLKQWLQTQATKAATAVVKGKNDLAAAKAAEKAGKLGQAYGFYQAVIQNGGEEAGPAQSKVKSISEAGEKAMAEIEKSLQEKRYVDATKALVAGSATYAGAPVGDQFKTRLDQVRSDPSIKTEVEQARTDAAADADEATARSAEKLGDFKRAISIYERYVVAYPASHHITAIRDHLAALKSDKSIQSGIASRAADDDCKAWLGMADNYIKSGLTDKARPYLQKIIDTYPNASYAAVARRELAELK
jgi:predicted esterase